jgi:hypothetical protein
MACLQFKPAVTLPALPPGFSFLPPGLALPSFDAALCCKIHIPIPIPPLFLNPLTVNPVFLAAINAVLAQVQRYVDELDAVSLECPLE